MKLYEFHVSNTTPCAPSHGNAITSSRIRIAGVTIHFTNTACSQHNRTSSKCVDLLSFDLKGIDTMTLGCLITCQVPLSDQVHRHPAFTQFNERMRLSMSQ